MDNLDIIISNTRSDLFKHNLLESHAHVCITHPIKHNLHEIDVHVCITQTHKAIVPRHALYPVPGISQKLVIKRCTN